MHDLPTDESPTIIYLNKKAQEAIIKLYKLDYKKFSYKLNM